MKGLAVSISVNPINNFMQTIEIKIKVNSKLIKFKIGSQNIGMLLKIW